jgi:hypothetical protein
LIAFQLFTGSPIQCGLRAKTSQKSTFAIFIASAHIEWALQTKVDHLKSAKYDAQVECAA